MKTIFSIYLFALCCLIGIEIALGALVAPTIFFPQKLIGDGVLTQFQSGQIMTTIFLKYNSIAMGIAIFSFIFEMVNLNNNKNQTFNIKFSMLMLSLINLILTILFVLVFSDYIVEAQKMGENATKTQEFLQIHNASEWCMKLIIVAQTVLFFIKFTKTKFENS